jgi:hypothetical protein
MGAGVRMNGLPKSSPKSRRSVTYFLVYLVTSPCLIRLIEINLIGYEML